MSTGPATTRGPSSIGPKQHYDPSGTNNWQSCFNNGSRLNNWSFLDNYYHWHAKSIDGGSLKYQHLSYRLLPGVSTTAAAAVLDHWHPWRRPNNDEVFLL